MAVDAVAGAELKVGCLDDTGWVAFVRDGTALVRRFEPEPDEPHPDLGCNVEVYCGPSYLELEVVGPIRLLPPGASATLRRALGGPARPGRHRHGGARRARLPHRGAAA